MVTLPDGKTTYPTQGSQITPNAHGKFSIDYMPIEVGSYTIEATRSSGFYYSGTTLTVSFDAVDPIVASSPSMISLSGPDTAATGTVMNVDGNAISDAAISIAVEQPSGNITSTP